MLLLVNRSDEAHKLALEYLGRENHPDLHVYYPEGKSAMHSIDSMRELSSQVYMTPSEGPWKVFIIEYAERMLPTSANALLKTFEEPSKNTFICLVTDHHEAILPTILSRCQMRLFPPAAEKKADPLLIHALRDHTYEMKEIAEVMEKRKKKLYTETTKKLMPPYEITAAAKERIDQQIEGVVALAYAKEVDTLFADILYWYRDLHMLQESGDTEHIHHREHIPELLERISRPLPSLESVIDAIEDARLASRRFTRLATCLEALFLKILDVSDLAPCH